MIENILKTDPDVDELVKETRARIDEQAEKVRIEAEQRKATDEERYQEALTEWLPTVLPFLPAPLRQYAKHERNENDPRWYQPGNGAYIETLTINAPGLAPIVVMLEPRKIRPSEFFRDDEPLRWQLWHMEVVQVGGAKHIFDSWDELILAAKDHHPEWEGYLKAVSDAENGIQSDEPELAL